MDVCILRKPRFDQIPLGFYQLWSSKAHQSNLLEIMKAKEIMIKPNRDEYANVDGESIHVGRAISIKINTQSLRVWVPKT